MQLRRWGWYENESQNGSWGFEVSLKSHGFGVWFVSPLGKTFDLFLNCAVYRLRGLHGLLVSEAFVLPLWWLPLTLADADLLLLFFNFLLSGIALVQCDE